MLQEAHGWLLRCYSQGDSNVIAQFFSLEIGRIDLMARGGRKNPLLQPFQPLWLSWGGRAKLPSLRRLETTAAAVPLADRPLWCGFYVNELLIRLLAVNQPSTLLFACYGETLAGLVAADDPRPVLRRFELQLLADCGYALELQVDTNGQPIEAQDRYQWHDGGLAKAARGFSGADIIGFAAGDWNASIARTSRDLLRLAIDRQLGGRPLKSRDWFRQLAGPA